MFKTILFLLLPLVSAYSQSDFESLIVNGSELGDRLPQMQKILTDGVDCSATLIGPRVVVTAAHCIKKDSIAAVYFAGDGKDRIAKNLTRHPQYKPNRSYVEYLANINDMALAVLDMPVTKFSPLTMFGAPKLGDTLLVLGRGSPSFTRRYAWLDVHLSLPQVFHLVPPKGSEIVGDSGDSGGPVLQKDQQGHLWIVGLLSTSTRTQPFLKWPAYTTSAIALDQKEIHDFLDHYANQYQVEICGINLSCEKISE